jgi:POT family proton-dependent oligopeptide transporter
MRRSLTKEINTSGRKGEAFPHCAAAKPRWLIEWHTVADAAVPRETSFFTPNQISDKSLARASLWLPNLHVLRFGKSHSISRERKRKVMATMDRGLENTAQPDAFGTGRQPRGLATLFFTELWERFSYYGMRAILVLYMVAPVSQGGLGFDTKHAASIYGTYTMSVYLTALPGGMLADRILGAKLAVLLGGIVIACGHFSMVFHSLTFFYLGMVLIAVGTGLLKPNISAMVGSLYTKDDPRRDSGFSIFYMGINIGAVLAPLVCGYLAQGESFKGFVARMGFDVSTSWHWGFGAAGVGMCLGLIIYGLNRKRLPDVDRSVLDIANDLEPATDQSSATATDVSPGPRQRRANPLIAVVLSLILPGAGHLYRGQTGAGLSWLFAFVLAGIWYLAGGGIILGIVIIGIVIACAISAARRPKASAQLTPEEWKRVGAIFVFFLFTILFWAAYEQKGASLNLFAKDLVRTEVFGMKFPSSWLQSCTPAFVIMLAPIFSYLWLRLGKRQPSSPVKFTLGLLFIGLAYCLLVPAAWMTAYGRISPLWLVGLYFLEVVGEMCLSPVGLSTVTKLAPVKLVGIMMGVWFLAASFGSKLAGKLSEYYLPNSATLVKLYGGIAVGLLISAGLLALLTPRVKKLMGSVN